MVGSSVPDKRSVQGYINNFNVWDEVSVVLTKNRFYLYSQIYLSTAQQFGETAGNIKRQTTKMT